MIEVHPGTCCGSSSIGEMVTGAAVRTFLLRTAAVLPAVYGTCYRYEYTKVLVQSSFAE